MHEDALLEYFDFCDELSQMTQLQTQLAIRIDRLSNLISLTDSIKTYGISESTLSMFGPSLRQVCPDLIIGNTELALGELYTATEGVTDSIGQFIKDIIAQLISFLRKFFSSKNGVISSISNASADFRKFSEKDSALDTEVYGYHRTDFDSMLRTFDSHIQAAKDYLGEWGIEKTTNERVMQRATSFFNGLGFMVDSDGGLVPRKDTPQRTKVTIREHGFNKLSIESNIDLAITVLKRSKNLEAMANDLHLTYTSGFIGQNRTLEAADKRDFLKLVSNTSSAVRYLANIAMTLGVQQIDMMRAYRTR